MIGADHASPSGAAFTVVLLLHVAAALVGMITLVAGAIAAWRVLAAGDGQVPAPARSYFSPGPNWAGRSLYLVPVLGFVLIGLSGGDDAVGDAWVLIGLGLWVAAAAMAEAVLWPAERRVQRALAAGTVPLPAHARGACRVVCAAAALILCVLVTAMVVMFARP